MADGAAPPGECGGVTILVEDRPAPRCASLFGDTDTRAENERWRSERIKAVRGGSRTLDVVHADAQLRRPEVRSLSGMVVREIFHAEVVEERCADVDHDDDHGARDGVQELDDEELDAGFADDGDAGLAHVNGLSAETALETETVLERVARVELSKPWAELCGEDTVVLRVDDALGERGRVLHIDRRGLLAHLGGQLVWLSRSGVEPPVFRTTWRSGFSVVTDVAKPAPKPAPKKRARARRGRRR